MDYIRSSACVVVVWIIAEVAGVNNLNIDLKVDE